MPTNILSPAQRTGLSILKWTVILGASQAFAALLVFSTFVNNYSYFQKAAKGDAAKFCTPYLNSLKQNRH